MHDGHGGAAVAEWLEKNLLAFLEDNWTGAPAASITEAFIKADAKILSASSGFLGMGERGIGGSRCGATSAMAAIFQVRVRTAAVLLQLISVKPPCYAIAPPAGALGEAGAGDGKLWRCPRAADP